MCVLVVVLSSELRHTQLATAQLLDLGNQPQHVKGDDTRKPLGCWAVSFRSNSAITIRAIFILLLLQTTLSALFVSCNTRTL